MDEKIKKDILCQLMLIQLPPLHKPTDTIIQYS